MNEYTKTMYSEIETTAEHICSTVEKVEEGLNFNNIKLRKILDCIKVRKEYE